MFAGAEVAIKVVNQPKGRSVDSDGAGSEAESDLEQEWTETYPVEMRATPTPPRRDKLLSRLSTLRARVPWETKLERGHQ